jgi:GNAT superfamily N-acetyltransferase
VQAARAVRRMTAWRRVCMRRGIADDGTRMGGEDGRITLRVTYMEMRQTPVAVPAWRGREQVRVEKLGLTDYLALYREVGGPLRWDQRTQMPAAELDALLRSSRLRIHVLRSPDGRALGFCEFDRSGFPDIEIKHFGLVPPAYGRGLGPWLLTMALQAEWRDAPARIWLHTDTWDHPAAVPVYERAGFRVYAVRDEPAAGL